LSALVIDSVVVEGQSMRQTLVKDKRDQKAVAKSRVSWTRFSSGYWQSLKNKLHAAVGAASGTGLQVKDPDEPIDGWLQKALELYFTPNTTKRSASALRSLDFIV